MYSAPHLELEEKINFAVFPSCQGGPHNNTIAGVAIALKQVMTPEFKKYAVQVKKNAKALGETLMGLGYKLVTDGTENHLVLWDLRPVGLTGSKMEKICDMVNITLNKNAGRTVQPCSNPFKHTPPILQFPNFFLVTYNSCQCSSTLFTNYLISLLSFSLPISLPPPLSPSPVPFSKP